MKVILRHLISWHSNIRNINKVFFSFFIQTFGYLFLSSTRQIHQIELALLYYMSMILSLSLSLFAIILLHAEDSS